MNRAMMIAALGLAPLACSSPDDRCAPDREACSLEHTFAALALAPGEEDDDICISWTLGNETDLWINTVESRNEGFVHHSNWFYVPDFRYVADEVWRCSEHDWNELANALLGGVVHAQSTQAESELQAFQPGAAIRLPPHSRIVANVHLLNASEQSAATQLSLRLDTIAPNQVSVELQPFEIMYRDLALPPETESAFRADCDVSVPFRAQLETDYDARIHYLMPHYHSLGDMFEVRALGGARDGEVLYASSGDTFGDALGKTFDPPIDLGGSRGLSFRCGFYNPSTDPVGWGIGDQEMCLLFGFAESRARFRGMVELTEQIADGARPEHTGTCNVLLQH